MNLANWFNDLSPAAQSVIGGLLGFGAVVVVIGAVVSAIALLAPAFLSALAAAAPFIAIE